MFFGMPWFVIVALGVAAVVAGELCNQLELSQHDVRMNDEERALVQEKMFPVRLVSNIFIILGTLIIVVGIVIRLVPAIF